MFSRRCLGLPKFLKCCSMGGENSHLYQCRSSHADLYYRFCTGAGLPMQICTVVFVPVQVFPCRSVPTFLYRCRSSHADLYYRFCTGAGLSMQICTDIFVPKAGVFVQICTTKIIVQLQIPIGGNTIAGSVYKYIFHFFLWIMGIIIGGGNMLISTTGTNTETLVF